MEKKARLVPVIGVLNILFSAILLLFSCFNVVRFIIALLSVFSAGHGRFTATMLMILLFLSLLLIPYCIFWIIVGRGLLKFKNWARRLTIIGPLLPLPVVLMGAAFGFIRLVLISLFLFYLFYLTRPKVKEQFK